MNPELLFFILLAVGIAFVAVIGNAIRTAEVLAHIDPTEVEAARILFTEVGGDIQAFAVAASEIGLDHDDISMLHLLFLHERLQQIKRSRQLDC